MATLCGTEPEFIRPDDSMRTLLDLQFDSGFIEDFIFEVEEETGRNLNFSTIPDPEPYGFADYVIKLAEINDVNDAEYWPPI